MIAPNHPSLGTPIYFGFPPGFHPAATPPQPALPIHEGPAPIVPPVQSRVPPEQLPVEVQGPVVATGQTVSTSGSPGGLPVELTGIVDPVTGFRGPDSEVHALLLRMMDILKTRGITTIFTSLTSSDERVAQGDLGLTSLMEVRTGETLYP